jgi:conjugative relaxase-like TrwC/TraI family protein
MSVGKMAVATADNYHQKDGYHSSEGQGVYYGKLAEEYGLDGQPIGDEWHNLIRGRSPDGTESYIDHQNRGEDEQRAGTDLVFNDNKSSSILTEVYGDTQNKELSDFINIIKETRHESIYETLDMIQEKYLATRMSENGQQRLENTDNGIFGIFQHHFSRDGDPHSHVHVFTVNQTRRKDGTIRAVENNPILKNQRWIGQYQTNLWAAKLEQRGIALVYNKDGSFETAGVPRELIDHFSKSKHRISEEAEKLRQKYPNASEAQLKEWANLNTRPYKNRELTVSEQRRDVWRPEALRMGYTDEKIIQAQKEARKERMMPAREQMSPAELMRRGADLATHNESVVSRAEILTAAAKLGSGVHPQVLEQAFDKAVKSRKLQYKEHANGYTTQEAVKRLSNIIKDVSEGRGTQEPIMTRDEAQRAVEVYRTSEGHELTNDQKGALQMLLSSKDQFMAVYGFAGVGKSSLFDAFRKTGKGKSIEGMSFTGRASTELRTASGIETRTIDSFLSSGEKMKQGMIYVIDEASFVGDRQMHQLVSQSRETGTRLIFSGDPGQFKAISAGNPFKLMEGNLDQYHVREIVRQSDGLDKEISTLFGEGKATEAVEMLINKGTVIQVKDRDELMSKMVEDYFDRGSSRTALMTPWNRTRIELNERIHNEAIKRGEIGEKGWTVDIRQPVSLSPTEQHFANAYQVGQFAFFRTGRTKGREGKIIEINQRTQTVTLETAHGTKIAIDVARDGEQLSIYEQKQIELNPGEKVVFLKNNHHAKWNVDNGQTGTLLRVRDDGRSIFEINGKERAAPANYNYFDQGWCITDVKAQGISERHAMADSPDNTNSLYVMATRHKNKNGFRLYTSDIKEIRAAARNLDKKYSAISNREAEQIAREHDGRNKQNHGPEIILKENTNESRERQISHDVAQRDERTDQRNAGQHEDREEIEERSRETGHGREIEMEM